MPGIVYSSCASATWIRDILMDGQWPLDAGIITLLLRRDSG